MTEQWQELKKTITELRDNDGTGTQQEVSKFLVNLMDVLEKKMSSSEKPSQWVPCSERLPEEHEWIWTKKFGTTISDEVYVTFENEKGERFCQHMTFQNGELSRYDKAYMEVWHKGSKPIAWMPLPEPYKMEVENDE